MVLRANIAVAPLTAGTVTASAQSAWELNVNFYWWKNVSRRQKLSAWNETFTGCTGALIIHSSLPMRREIKITSGLDDFLLRYVCGCLISNGNKRKQVLSPDTALIQKLLSCPAVCWLHRQLPSKTTEMELCKWLIWNTLHAAALWGIQIALLVWNEQETWFTIDFNRIWCQYVILISTKTIHMNMLL